MLTGTVHQFNKQKGYGFITPDDRGKDLFVHFQQLSLRALRPLMKDNGFSLSKLKVNGECKLSKLNR